ncbi:MAG: aldehyde oxidase [Herbaspirillum sp.]|jgi:CO/xanthine dehydrogenase Mo-binding subunit|nr:aldehyde oxidase [Herbaspirillum sp.]
MNSRILDYPRHVLQHADLTANLKPRPDAADKLAAQAGYLTDRYAAGMLHAKVLRSPHAHADIVSIDTSAAAALPGVRAVVTAKDVPGRNAYGLRAIDQPAICGDRVRVIGDPVAAVAADTPAIADAALALIKVEYAPLAVIDDPQAALAPGAIAIHPDGNLLHQMHYQHGEMRPAWARCAHIVEQVYETGRQMHCFIETEGGIVEPETRPDGSIGLAIYVGSQHPQNDQKATADILGMPLDRIRITASPVGGSFGGKEELTVQPIAALLALKTGRPVRLHYTRPESVAIGIKRHPFRMRLKTGCDAQGKLIALEAELLADTGAYATHGPEVLDTAHEHVQGAYNFDAVKVDSYLAYTNNGIAGAFRGFGAIQVHFAIEQQIDRLARAAGIDPLQFRRINVSRRDDLGPFRQPMAPIDALEHSLAVLERHPRWTGAGSLPQDPSGRYRRGTGISLIRRSDGFSRSGPVDGCIKLALAADGMIELTTGFIEMGQGLIGAIQALLARQFGCAESDTRAVVGRSDMPDPGPTVASRATNLLWRALAEGSGPWRAQLLQQAARCIGVAPDKLTLGPQGIRRKDNGVLLLTYKKLAGALAPLALPVRDIEVLEHDEASWIPAAHYVFCGASSLAQVRVDTWTGAVQVEHLLLIPALGPVISAQGMLGQIEGGAVMALGLALLENLPSPNGQFAARNFDGYFIPSLADAPRIEVIAIEDLVPGDKVGPRGAGEISVSTTLAAIANAVSDALGCDVARVPLLPADVLALLETP